MLLTTHPSLHQFATPEIRMMFEGTYPSLRWYPSRHSKKGYFKYTKNGGTASVGDHVVGPAAHFKCWQKKLPLAMDAVAASLKVIHATCFVPLQS